MNDAPHTPRAALANVLGALALVVTDETCRAVRAASGADSAATTDAAALSALAQFLDGATVDRLHAVLGVTPSGAVRLVDRLAAAGLATRDPGPDGRTRAIRLTDAGRDRARAVGEARSAYLDGLLDDLAPAEVEELHRLLGLVMARVVATKDGGAWTCRLCDLVACGRPAGWCPAATAARARYGEPTA